MSILLKRFTHLMGNSNRKILKAKVLNTIASSQPMSMAYVIRPIVFCGPSGVGKSTLLKRLMNEHPHCFAFSISHTTREPRIGEVNGKDYYFVSKQKMEKDISANKFIEHVNNYGNYYGTSIQAIRDISDSGRICILDIDTKGVISVKKTDLNPKYIFIRPPSYDELEKRLVRRGTENKESLDKRLALAKSELEFGEKEGIFDLVIINDDLEDAYATLKEFLKDDIEHICSKVLPPKEDK